MSSLRACLRPLVSPAGQSSRALSSTCIRPEAKTPAAGLLSDLNPESQSKLPKYRPSKSPSRPPGAMGLVQQQAQAQRNIQEGEATRQKIDLDQQMPRKWKPGDVYAPHDLSAVEARKWKMAMRAPTIDAFDTLALDPKLEYKNFSIMSEYMTEMGRIKHSAVTGLRPVNQRRIAKAIRRAIGIGIMPSVHIHPELMPKPGGTGGTGKARR